MEALQRVSGVLKIISICIVGTIGAYGVKQILRPCALYVIFDTCIAMQSRCALKQALVPDALRNYGSYGLEQQLSTIFPALRSVAIAYDASRTAEVTIKAYAPILRVISQKNQENGASYCVTSNGKLVSTDLFNAHMVAQLPTMYILSYGLLDAFTECIQQELLSNLCANTLQYVFNNYQVTWHSKNKLVLASYAYPEVTLIADCAAFNTKKLEYAERIYKNMHKESALTLDIRLGDFIVCAHLKGGGI